MDVLIWLGLLILALLAWAWRRDQTVRNDPKNPPDDPPSNSNTFDRH